MLIFIKIKVIGEGVLIEMFLVKYVDILCLEFVNFIFSVKIIYL